jgi:branched-chain amino acid transport system substrate-binding protein
MSKRNELPALAASLIITAAILGAGAWWLKGQFTGDGSTQVNNSQGQSAGGGSSSSSSSNSGSDSNGFNNASATDTSGGSGLAAGSIFKDDISAAKKSGLEAYNKGDYDTAQTEFENALKAKRNDPESLIYLNNAKIGKDRAHTIALSLPAGKSPDPAAEIMRGVAQAQQDINNAGGIDGVPLSVRLINDDDDAKKAADVARELVADKSVLGVIGHYSSDTTIGAASVYEQGKLVMISPTSTAVKIAEAGDYIFRTVPSDRLAAATLSKHMINSLDKTKAAIFFVSDSTFSQSVKSEFTTELLSNGGQVVSEFDVIAPDFNAADALAEAQSAGAEVILLNINTKNLATAIEVIQANQQTLPMIGNDSMYNATILKENGESALGLTVAVPWHILRYQQSPFVTESRQLWGGDVSWRTAMAYDAVKTLTTAMGDDPTRESIQAALASSSFSAEGATDAVRFFPSGDRTQPSQLVKVVPSRAAGGEYAYEPVQ